jgi:hypothetical protein
VIAAGRGDGRGDARPHQGPPPVGAAGRGANAAADQQNDPKADSKNSALRIDLGPLRQQIYQQMFPTGQAENMTPEQRKAVGREMNQRLLGIQQGIQLGAAELQKIATDAQRVATGQAKAADASAKAAAASSKVARDKQSVATTEKTVAAEKAAVAPMKKKSALSGNRLDVRMERDGTVLQEVNAEINLQNVLQTVFSTTRTDRGEVPFAIAKDGHLYTPTEADKKKIENLGAALDLRWSAASLRPNLPD